MFLDDSACNLASLNLMRFRKEVDGVMEFDVGAFKYANEIIITAMEIMIGNSSYPTPAIEENSLTFRPLGIGYANLGALLMSRGLAYDSDEGRNLAAAITSLQSGACYAQSTRVAEKHGPFAAFQENSESVLDVMRMHRDAADKIFCAGVPSDICAAAKNSWHEVVERGARFGLRNAQISVLAPTGTIAFLMDCDTTGVEPDIALVKYKWLVGGGMIKIVNNTVPEALTRLGYSENQRKEILDYISEKDTIEGAPHVKEEHLAVFDCAFRPANGKRSIQYMGHLRMMAAVQPFLSGAISKTVNMPNESTPEDIEKVYIEAWKMGLKAVAIYRDGSKRQQPLTTSLDKDQSKKTAPAVASLKKSEVAVGDGRGDTIKPLRRRLPDERKAVTHKFQVGTFKGYITVGVYDDGTPGELFVTMSKEGSVISGLADAFATSVSIGLQYGVPLQVLVNKFVHMRFEPSGYTNNPNIRIAKSLIDYIFRWIAMKFMTPEEQRAVGIMNVVEPENNGVESGIGAIVSAKKEESSEEQPTLFTEKKSGLTSTFDNQSDAPACPTCGSIMVRNAACYKCLNCGATSGCS
jgi:ribonucleoside-diphosphate reductase alpha chain